MQGENLSSRTTYHIILSLLWTHAKYTKVVTSAPVPAEVPSWMRGLFYFFLGSPSARSGRKQAEYDSLSSMVNAQTRRNFLRTAPLAAAVSLPLANRLLSAQPAPAQSGTTETAAAPEPFRLLKAQTIAVDAEALAAKPGNTPLFDAKTLPFNIVLTTETDKSAKEFEWHEGRDHIFQILSGETVYLLGGTPDGAHNTKPGEWLAPDSTGATSVTLKKGDMLVIPRGTPHKRTTKGTVTFTLISTTGVVTA